VVAETPPKSRRRRIAAVVGIALAVVLVYAGSLLSYHWLAGTSQHLPPPDLGTAADTVVLLKIEALHTADNRLDVKVIVLPKDSLMDTRLNVLNTDIAVRFYPETELGDLQFAKGSPPAQRATMIAADGDPDRWPFDSYTTETIGAAVLVGTGDSRQYIPARVEVTGYLDGWALQSVRSGESTQSSGAGDFVRLTLQRAKGPLVFDLGICLVLISLPVMALLVAIPMVRGKKKFMPPFSTWYAAMLFAIVPLRNILPGAPPPGAWIDQAIVLWVLIALIVAMALYVLAWYRYSD
jgi:hypothetical protein